MYIISSIHTEVVKPLFTCSFIPLSISIIFDDLLIIFIKIYASNFVLHVVASLLGAGNAGNEFINQSYYFF